ncbi:MAG: DNA polymerase Y family protein [Pseudomonadota bacterium]
MSSRLFQLPLLPRHLHAVKSRGTPPPGKPVNAGKHSRRHSPLWYAVHLPQLSGAVETAGTALLLQQRLSKIAEVLGNLSATVSVQPPDSLLFEVRSTLRYFGGMEKIRQQVQKLLELQLQTWGLPMDFHHAASPTPAASLLLARAGHNVLIHRTDNLRSVLGKLSVQALPLPPDKRKQLHNTGLRRLRDIWRLPTHALGQRFGLDFIRQLDRCLGKVAMPLKRWQSSPVCHTAVEFDYPVENTSMLLPHVATMLGTVTAFLQRHELATTHLLLELRHEKPGGEQPSDEWQQSTTLSLDLRQPSRQQDHLRLLLETRIHHLVLPAPVIGLRLEARHFAPFIAAAGTLRGLSEGATEGVAAASQEQDGLHDIVPLLEQLQARLGNAAVRSILSTSEHCPEYAGQDRTFTGKVEARPSKPQADSRPCWLLPEPVALEQNEGKLYYRSSLSLLSGPERIETRWWTGQEVRRDYYVACNRQGMRLWIFHERRGERQWFLHGIFD